MNLNKAGIFTADGTDGTDDSNSVPSIFESVKSVESVVQFLCVRLAALLACVLLLPCAFCLRASGQNYTISWYKIAGGGGTSTNGRYAVTGSIGQRDAGPTMTGGGYSVTGGFWSLIAVQTPGAPLLSIAAAGNQVIVSWPSPSTGYILQTNSSLNPTNWGGYSGNVNNSSATISPPRGNVFFRLYHP